MANKNIRNQSLPNTRDGRKQMPQKKKEGVIFNYAAFKEKHHNKLLIISCILAVLLLISIFKNISYPLLWSDEAMTAMGAERVIKFGYPKVHDGKNTFYDLTYSNNTLGINEKDDAYIGGTNWGHYYFGTIGYKLTENIDDIYTKTGLFRATFAIMGVAGLFLLCYSMSGFFEYRFVKYAFVGLFLLFELSSISLLLHIRELRYYSLAIALIAVIVSMYSVFRFLKPYNKFLYVTVQTLVLWMLFNTFSPSYFIIVLSIGICEVVISIIQFYRTKNLKNSFFPSVVPIIPLLISLIAVIPELSYFKTFYITKALAEFYGFSVEHYWDNFSMVLGYFRNLELLYLAVVFKIMISIHLKYFLNSSSRNFKVSNFFTLLFLLFIFIIARIPYPLFTRYYIIIQPILSCIILFDFFLLLGFYSRDSKSLLNYKMTIPVFILIGFFCFNIHKNMSNVTGHFYELTHQYKGPMDYTVPYIKSIDGRTDTLIIAANDEEVSYGFYLGCKYILSNVDVNIEKDSTLKPHIIAFRKCMGSHYGGVYNNFLKKAQYDNISFPVQDIYENNVPELYNPFVHHYFQTPLTDDSKLQINLFVLSSLLRTNQH